MSAKTTAGEDPKEPTLADLIAAAQAKEADFKDKDEMRRMAEHDVRQSKQDAKLAWDAIYDTLVQLKQIAGSSEAFRESKLGQLLNNVRV